ncbi:hypothetical protein DSAG12_01013 [Promethearchaeum syntrophicum]|uniref:Uncharacterized protein n=1 Tax=Promethearchaeum syntrophicum TaxID=2594042 RepID=A0A5B9D7M9_9ARCH|nr:hypothetical protein [Candidatus Prometheoarchaeum syntrophicum]QEE15189.1 hypothetical protein DSAG12_01013 [Candidatus Prometheoarchaeum syntrophicum]
MKNPINKKRFPFGLPSQILQTNNSMEMLRVHCIIDGFFETKDEAFNELHELSKDVYPKFMLALHYYMSPPSFMEAMKKNDLFRLQYANEENFHYFQEYMASGFEELFQITNFIPESKKFRWVANSDIIRENTEWDSSVIFFFPNARIMDFSPGENTKYFQEELLNTFNYIKKGLDSRESPLWIKHTALLMLIRLCPNYKNKIVLQLNRASIYGLQDVSQEEFDEEQRHRPQHQPLYLM